MAEVENLTNQRIDGAAVVRLTGRFMGTGETHATMRLHPRAGGADADLTVRIEGPERKSEPERASVE